MQFQPEKCRSPARSIFDFSTNGCMNFRPLWCMNFRHPPPTHGDTRLPSCDPITAGSSNAGPLNRASSSQEHMSVHGWWVQLNTWAVDRAQSVQRALNHRAPTLGQGDGGRLTRKRKAPKETFGSITLALALRLYDLMPACAHISYPDCARSTDQVLNCTHHRWILVCCLLLRHN